jgi:phage gpG-like protein
VKVVFKLDEGDLARLDRLIKERQDRGTDMRPVLREVSTDFFDLESQLFESQGRLILGRGWKKLNPKWLAYRQANGRGSRILEMEGGAGGRLRKSLTVPGAPYQRLDVSADELVVSTRLGIAKVHDRGGTVTISNASGTRTVKIPRRRMVRLRREDKLRWLGAAQRFISDGGAGRRRGL